MPLPQAKLELLFLSAQDGDQEAFSSLYQEHHKALLRYARTISNNASVAEDASQEAWLSFAKNIRKIRDPRAYKVWLYKLTRWRANDLSKRNANEVPSDDPHIESITTEDQQEISLTHEIKKLPTTERQIIQLFYLDELSTTEIAEALEIPQGTVKSRLYRARNLLKEKLKTSI